MNSLAFEFYEKAVKDGAEESTFSKVVYLDEHTELSFDDVKNMCPEFPKGWYELRRLSAKDKIDFVQEYWKLSLAFVPNFNSFITAFFSTFDDIGIFLFEYPYEDKYTAEMVYSSADNRSFFRGSIGASRETIHQFAYQFNNTLPSDYLSFLKVHNGFAKGSDQGILPTFAVQERSQQLHEYMMNRSNLATCRGKPVEPNSLIPFYDSHGIGDFQCFYLDWRPGMDAGNVYYSSSDNTISDYTSIKNLSEQLAFSSFFDWLIFYLEEFEL